MNHVDKTTTDYGHCRIRWERCWMFSGLMNTSDGMGAPEDADKMQWKSTWNKPLIVSEFGGGAPYGWHGDADERWTEEYQDNLYKHQLKMVERIPNLAGMTPWVLMDFRSPRACCPECRTTTTAKG